MKSNNSKYIKILKEEKLFFFIIFLLIFFIFVYQSGLYNFKYLSTPLGYQGDAIFLFSSIKTLLNNFPKLIFYSDFLNYPFGSNLEYGYFVPDKLLHFLLLTFAKFSNIFTSSSLVQMFSHVLPSLSLYYVARLFGISKKFSFVAAITFGLTPFIYARGLAHMNLSFAVFIIPLQIYLIFSLNENFEKIKLDTKKYHIIVLFISCILNYYFLFMTLLFIIFFLFMSLLNIEKKKFYYLLKLIVFVFFLIFIFNFSYFLNSDNNVFFPRNLASLEVYGLKMPELFYKTGYHKIDIFPRLSGSFYYNLSFVKGEVWGPYLGIVGIICFASLIIISLYKYSNSKKFYLGNLNFQLIFILIFSLIGGLNLLIGTIGFTSIRATNRYSIWILALVLIFFFKFLTDHNFKKDNIVKNFIILLFFIFTYLDLPQPHKASYLETINRAITMDKNFISQIEKNYTKPKIAMLPHIKFPENGPVLKMLDYEPLKLYIHSKNSYFSYGANQYNNNYKIVLDKEVYDIKTLNNFISIMQAYDYNLLLINKKAYQKNLIDNFENYLNKNFKILNYEHQDYLIYDISNKKNNLTTQPIIFFNTGWSENEITHRWAVHSEGKITIITNIKKKISLSMGIHSYYKERDLEIFLNNKSIYKSKIDGDNIIFNYKFYTTNKVNNLVIKVSGKKYRAGISDPRKITFQINNLKINYEN